ncbi:MAG: hypothetical protein HYS81_04175 [Candidatus Aenigmatarchaeota archaeon]|nr:MAG: hypothetical protein HYS81_04175 [Candidatus Aenigmarchaeota archaeon]
MHLEKSEERENEIVYIGLDRNGKYSVAVKKDAFPEDGAPRAMFMDDMGALTSYDGFKRGPPIAPENFKTTKLKADPMHAGLLTTRFL